MITSIYFQNFKALENYAVSLKDFNILTGPNNNGKSTILDALKLLRGAYGYASRLNPSYHEFPDGNSGYGYIIPQSSIPIILNNIQTNLNDTIAKIRFRFKDGQNITLIFSNDHPTYMSFDTPRKIPTTSSSFKKEFPLKISIIPTLGPLEIEEERLNEDYVKQWSGSRRAPRMFRNFWFYNPDDFELFRELVETSWNGMSIGFPEKKSFSKELMMFCYENRIAREICWSGFGFQIWIQLLTHIIKSKDADIIVVDEPEIYLHPDLQHKILDLLKNSNSRVVLATHSIEIINNADPSDILVIDKNLRSARRITDLQGLQNVFNLLGSGQNIHLTRLAKGKKILFVEGLDSKLLTKFSKITKYKELFTSGEITVIPIDGFSQHERVINANWAFSQILGEQLKIAALFDRDYRTEEEINKLKERFEKEINYVHVLKRKEIENYLLIPSAIGKAINERINDKKSQNETSQSFNINEILFRLTEDFKSHVHAQLSAHKIRLGQKNDIATILQTFTKAFEIEWRNLEFRLNIVPGKIFLSALNEYLQKEFQISITTTQIINNCLEQELDEDVQLFFEKLLKFSKEDNKG